MDDVRTLSHLEELSQRLGITVMYECVKISGSLHAGGFCRVKGQDFAIINKHATTREKIHILTDALKRYDLSEVYLLPSLRSILDGENRH